MTTTYDVAIIGGGVSGFSAAMYCGRFGMKTVLITENRGGAILLTSEIANYPGFKKISGLDLFKKIEEQAEQFDIKVIEKEATRISKEDEFKVFMGPDSIQARTVIYCTGGDWKKLRVPGEKEFAGKGVHYCAICDGAFYKDKVIAIIGGADAACKEALTLAGYGSKVYIIYRKDKVRCEDIIYRQIEGNRKIEIITNTNVTAIKGDKFVNKVILDKEYHGSKELALDAVFVAIGHVSVSEIAGEAGVKLNEKGEVIVDKIASTNVPGFFAAGDVTDEPYKQAVIGVGHAIVAAHSAYYYLKKK